MTMFGSELLTLRPDQWTAPFWDAAHDGRLVAPRCQSCNTFRMPPSCRCHACRASTVDWVELPGTGVVYTYTITRHAFVGAAREAVPYIVAVVSLDDAEPVRLITNIVNCPTEQVAIGMPVQAVFQPVSEQTTLPVFQPSTG